MNDVASGVGHPLKQLVIARLREFIREPAAIFWVYGFPLVMMVALGIAFRNRPIETFNVDVVEHSQAEGLREQLLKDPRFNPQHGSTVEVHDEATCRQRLRTSKTALVIRMHDVGEAQLSYAYDPTNPGSVLARDAVDSILQTAAGRSNPRKTENIEIDEPGGRYIDFLVPGLIGMGLMGGGLWGVGFATVNLRIRKLLKRYLATPMKRQHFLAAMMISRLVFMIPEILAVVGAAWLFFDVRVHGSLAAVVLLVVLGAFQFAGIGLLIASRAQTLETVSGLMNLVMLPMWIASGVFYSIERFPDAVQPVLKVLPLTPLINALRGVMQEGAALTSLGPELAIMIAWGAVTFSIALRVFRWN